MRRRISFPVWLLIAILAAAAAELIRSGPGLFGGAPRTTGEPIVGRARVVDGDSLEVSGHRIRLHGIDAPEGRQNCRDGAGATYACGEEARRALIAAASGHTVSCAPVGTSHDRTVAQCTVDGRDLSEAMVRGGHALELRRHSGDRYAAAEREAREAGRGLWRGAFDRPADWRRDHPR